jgi:hypothetical protein
MAERRFSSDWAIRRMIGALNRPSIQQIGGRDARLVDSAPDSVGDYTGRRQA